MYREERRTGAGIGARELAPVHALSMPAQSTARCTWCQIKRSLVSNFASIKTTVSMNASIDVISEGIRCKGKLLAFETCEETDNDFFQKGITNVDARIIAENLHKFKRLRMLNLGCDQVSDEGASWLADALQDNTSLRVLGFWSNLISDAGASALARALKTNNFLTRLVLGSNFISDDGVCALARSLQTNNSLTEISLDNNQVADVGACALAEALITSSCLTALDLDNNQVSDVGACSLADALKTNSALKFLGLRGNRFSDSGAISLASALKCNVSLAQLLLDKNQVSDSGAFSLADALITNTSLTEMDLGKTSGMHSICSAAKQTIETHVKRNKDNPEQARAKVSSFKAKYDALMSRPPAPDFDCSCLFDEVRLLDVVARAAEEHPGSAMRLVCNLLCLGI